MLRDYGDFMPGKIYSLAVSSDNRWLFAADSKGHLKQIDMVDNMKPIIDYGKVCDAGIFSINCTPESRYIFTTDISGNIKQFSIEEKSIVMDYGKTHDGGILTSGISNDGIWMCSSDDQGNLKQLLLNWKNNEEKINKGISMRIIRAEKLDGGISMGRASGY